MSHFNDTRTRSQRLADRLIIDLRGFDYDFIKSTCDIFHTDYYRDGKDSRNIRDWVQLCISDIVALFSFNPQTIHGTLNIGADLRTLEREEFQSLRNKVNQDDLEEFNNSYKVLSTNIYYVLSEVLEEQQNRAIDDGYSDIECSMVRYCPGHVVVNVRPVLELPY